MFDGVGLVGAVRGLGVDPAGRTVGLIGAGGAGSAIAFAMADAGARSLRVMDADLSRAERLAARVAEAGCPAKAGLFAAADVQILINATPVGMAEGDGSPIALSGLTSATTVVDIVTRPDTALLRAAAAQGCLSAGGSAMVRRRRRRSSHSSASDQTPPAEPRTPDDHETFKANWPFGTRERLIDGIATITGLRRGDIVTLGRAPSETMACFWRSIQVRNDRLGPHCRQSLAAACFKVLVRIGFALPPKTLRPARPPPSPKS